jgi:hypothetical protein
MTVAAPYGAVRPVERATLRGTGRRGLYDARPPTAAYAPARLAVGARGMLLCNRSRG